jgi:hypothetical protein
MSDYTRARWEEIKALKPQQALFWDSGRNGTYDAGKNKAKRERRSKDKPSSP